MWNATKVSHAGNCSSCCTWWKGTIFRGPFLLDYTHICLGAAVPLIEIWESWRSMSYYLYKRIISAWPASRCNICTPASITQSNHNLKGEDRRRPRELSPDPHRLLIEWYYHYLGNENDSRMDCVHWDIFVFKSGVIFTWSNTLLNQDIKMGGVVGIETTYKNGIYQVKKKENWPVYHHRPGEGGVHRGHSNSPSISFKGKGHHTFHSEAAAAAAVYVLICLYVPNMYTYIYPTWKYFSNNPLFILDLNRSIFFSQKDMAVFVAFLQIICSIRLRPSTISTTLLLPIRHS